MAKEDRTPIPYERCDRCKEIMIGVVREGLHPPVRDYCVKCAKIMKRKSNHYDY